MMLYLTGAYTPLSKSDGNSPAPEPSRSLGGNISSTPVPNGAINKMYDLISSYTLNKRLDETLGFGLVNKLNQSVKDITLKIISPESAVARFLVAAVPVTDLAFESIANRYELPIVADFYDASFFRAAVEVKILVPAQIGEEFVFYPIDIMIDGVKECSFDGTFEAISKSLINSNFIAVRISETEFRIEREDEEVVTPSDFSIISSGDVEFEFTTQYKNKVDNTVTLSDDELAPCKAIGIWIKRSLKDFKFKTDEQLMSDYENKVVNENIETIEFIISYNLVENVQ